VAWLRGQAECRLTAGIRAAAPSPFEADTVALATDQKVLLWQYPFTRADRIAQDVAQDNFTMAHPQSIDVGTLISPLGDFRHLSWSSHPRVGRLYHDHGAVVLDWRQQGVTASTSLMQWSDLANDRVTAACTADFQGAQLDIVATEHLLLVLDSRYTTRPLWSYRHHHDARISGLTVGNSSPTRFQVGTLTADNRQSVFDFDLGVCGRTLTQPSQSEHVFELVGSLAARGLPYRLAPPQPSGDFGQYASQRLKAETVALCLDTMHCPGQPSLFTSYSLTTAGDVWMQSFTDPRHPFSPELADVHCHWTTTARAQWQQQTDAMGALCKSDALLPRQRENPAATMDGSRIAGYVGLFLDIGISLRA
jgi:hypothetical protein